MDDGKAGAEDGFGIRGVLDADAGADVLRVRVDGGAALATDVGSAIACVLEDAEVAGDGVGAVGIEEALTIEMIAEWRAPQLLHETIVARLRRYSYELDARKG